MVLSDEKIREFMKRLLTSRMRILCSHGFFGLLLIHMIYSLDEDTETAYTDGVRIAFSPDFLDGLSDSELDFVMMHEILHIVLQHCLRSDKDEPERYNIAADIVVNSIIMNENSNDPRSITLSKYGESMHKVPNGKEGSTYTAEEVFEMLSPALQNKQSMNKGDFGNDGSKKGSSDKGGSDNGESSDGGDISSGWEDGREKNKQAKPRNSKRSCGAWDDHSHWGETEKDSILRDV